MELRLSKTRLAAFAAAVAAAAILAAVTFLDQLVVAIDDALWSGDDDDE